MFADSLLDSRWADRSRRGWTLWLRLLRRLSPQGFCSCCRCSTPRFCRNSNWYPGSWRHLRRRRHLLLRLRETLARTEATCHRTVG
jgi:hypothetical protein